MLVWPDEASVVVVDWVVQPPGGPGTVVVVVDWLEPSEPVVLAPPLTAAIMKPIEQVTRRIYPGIEVVPVLQSAGTDAVYLAESGIPTYGISGMFVDPDLGNIHGLNERIRVQSLYDGRDFLFSLVKLYAEQVR